MIVVVETVAELWAYLSNFHDRYDVLGSTLFSINSRNTAEL